MCRRGFFGAALFFGMAVILSLSSCAPLNKRQLGAVATFSQTTDSFACAPGRVYRSVAEFRMQRGLFTTATLLDPKMRTQELERMMEARDKEIQLSKKADLAFEAVSQYMRALKTLSSVHRVNGLPLEMRTLGKKIDSLLLQYNALGDVRPVPQGYATLSGKFIGRGTEWTLQYFQARHVKQWIVAGDTLVSSLMHAMQEVLLNEDLKAQLQHEREMLRQSYRSYLASGIAEPPRQSDALYLEMLNQLNELNALRLKAARTARSVRNAHAKLKATCLKPSSWEEDYQWILLAVTEMNEIQRDWKKLETLIH